MIGRMSAAGKLGKYRYEDPETKDWSKRVYYLSEDIQPVQIEARKSTQNNLEALE